MTATGASLLVEQLRALGVRQIFTLNGGHIAPIYDACLDGGPAIVDVRHEDAAVHMAHAYARVTGSPGVACLTAGPGVTNGISAVAAAWAAASPIVVIGGKVPTPQVDLGALQDVDQVSLLRPVTRSARTVLGAERIPEYVAEAFRLASLPPQAPTFVEVPTDVLRSVAPAVVTLYPPPAQTRPAPAAAAVNAAAEALRRAERPVLVAGSGVLWSGAEEAVRRLAERLSMPVLTTSLARGLLPVAHPLNLFAARSRLLRDADVVVVVGSRFNYVLNYGRPPRLPAAATLIHIDASAAEVDRNRRADIPIVADARAALEEIGDAVDAVPGDDRSWLADATAAHNAARERLLEPPRGDAIHPLELCNQVLDASPPGTRFVVDGGDILSFARLTIQPDGPRRFLDPGPYGGLGAGVPFANSVKLAAPDDAVVCITGDGALGFNVMELDTSVRHGLPIVVVVSNNSAWGIERNAQVEDFGIDRVVATELRDVRFDEVARALGCHAQRVTDRGEIAEAVRQAIASGETALIDVVTDVDVRSPDLRRGLATVPDRTPLAWSTGEDR
ncbi:MAG TPA: thiamine pyrophosphate-binding protein [Acidimicrobiia bacterium]|nr:thiamine pyrophosphate-binding protein [Acidimicrobiia bacterium]